MFLYFTETHVIMCSQMFNQKIGWLEASNMDLRRELDEAQERIVSLQRCALESQVSCDFLEIRTLEPNVCVDLPSEPCMCLCRLSEIS